MARHAQALGAAFAIRLLLTHLVFAQCGPCLQHGDSQRWIYDSLALALGRPEIYLQSLFWPPAFKLLAAALFKTAGFSFAVVVALQTALGLLSIALAYRLALRLFGAGAAFACALLTALMPMGAVLGLSGLAEPLYLILVELFFLAVAAGFENDASWRPHAAAVLALALALVTRYEALSFYAAFVALEAWRWRRRPRRGAAPRFLSAVLLPPLLFALWVLFAGRRLGDPLFWIRVTRADNAGGYLRGLGPRELAGFVALSGWRSYSWFLLSVPAAAAGLGLDRRLRGAPAARALNASALGALAALLAAAAFRLLSSDADRNLYVPLVLLTPYAALLLTDAAARARRVLPAAAATGASALLAALFAAQCARVALARGWCYPDAASGAGCALGGTLGRVAASAGGRERSMSCRSPAGDDFCVAATVCSGLDSLAASSSPASDAFYRLEPCGAGGGAPLAREGEACLDQRRGPFSP